MARGNAYLFENVAKGAGREGDDRISGAFGPATEQTIGNALHMDDGVFVLDVRRIEHVAVVRILISFP